MDVLLDDFEGLWIFLVFSDGGEILEKNMIDFFSEDHDDCGEFGDEVSEIVFVETHVVDDIRDSLDWQFGEVIAGEDLTDALNGEVLTLWRKGLGWRGIVESVVFFGDVMNKFDE